MNTQGRTEPLRASTHVRTHTGGRASDPERTKRGWERRLRENDDDEVKEKNKNKKEKKWKINKKKNMRKKGMRKKPQKKKR